MKFTRQEIEKRKETIRKTIKRFGYSVAMDSCKAELSQIAFDEIIRDAVK
jgi:hypothetical protein